MRRGLLTLMIGLVATTAVAWPWRIQPTATIVAEPSVIQPGQSATITWSATNATSAQLNITRWEPRTNGEIVPLQDSRVVTPEKTQTYTITAFYRRRDMNGNGRADGYRRSYTASTTVTVVSPTPPDPIPTPPEPTPPEPTPMPTPTPVPPSDNVQLSAVGIGSAFSLSTSLARAANSHDLSVLLSSQGGDWLVIDPMMLDVPHPQSMDAWMAVLKASSKAQPAVIWYERADGKVKVLGIDGPLSDATTDADLLKLAKSHLPVAKSFVTVRGVKHGLGLKPAPKGKKLTINGQPVKSVKEILTPLAEKDYPSSVDLRTQFRYIKDQGNYGTCVLNATCACFEAACFRMFGAANSTEFSPNFLAVQTNGWDGTYAGDAINVLTSMGVVTMAAQPNYSHNLPSGWRTLAAQNKALGVYGPPGGNTIGYTAAALSRGYPVLVGISVGNGFDPDSQGYITYARGSGYGVNHEVVVAGGFVMHNGKRFCLIQNSWGKSWGTFGDGCAYIEDRFLDDGDNDFWVIVVPSAATTYKFDAP